MNLYVAPCGLFAVFIEISGGLGARPAWSVKNCNGEVVIDAPYMQVIWTPGRKLKTAQGPGYDPRDRQSAQHPKGVAED